MVKRLATSTPFCSKLRTCPASCDCAPRDPELDVVAISSAATCNVSRAKARVDLTRDNLDPNPPHAVVEADFGLQADGADSFGMNLRRRLSTWIGSLELTRKWRFVVNQPTVLKAARQHGDGRKSGTWDKIVIIGHKIGAPEVGR